MLPIITSIGDRLFRFINIDDRERQWTSQKGFLVIFRNFWMQRIFQHWIATKWLEIDQDNFRMKFSAFNVDFSNPSSDFLGLRRSAQAGVKDGYPPIYFTAIISCSMKTVADRHRQAMMTSFFIGVNAEMDTGLFLDPHPTRPTSVRPVTRPDPTPCKCNALHYRLYFLQ